MSAHEPRPHRLPLGRRLTRTAIGAAAIALLVAGSVLNGGMFLLARQALLSDSVALAGVIAGNLAAPLAFGDRDAARETLETLAASTPVKSARLHDVHDVLFAAYGAVPAQLPALESAAGHRFEGRELKVWRTVEQQGQAFGRVCVTVSLDALYRQAALFGAITLAAALAALGIAYLLALGVRRDIDRVERRLDQMAYVDPVTGLHNRHAAGEQLRAAVCRARHAGSTFSLMLVDLDDFKVINDTLGHAVGDAVLHALAQRLHQALPPGVSGFRFGGDEFVVLIDEALAPQFSARALQHSLAAPLRVDSHEIVLRCSAGLARFPVDADDEQELLRAADAAMYHAKSLGKNGFAPFRPELRGATQQRLRIEAELRHALAHDELVLHYQPIVHLESGDIVGAEALLRWRHPERGLVGPAEFIGVAEDSGLIVEIGSWVLAEAAEQVRRWLDAGLDHFHVAVNASARQLRRGELVRQLDAAVAAARCPPHRLEIEITEHTLVDDAADNVQTLLALRERGVRIVIDDFGTGLSSLAYLKRLPVDKFKIDRSFVRELPAARGDLAIVRAVISMARALDLAVVAEGIETSAQRDVLSKLGCDFAQGWHFGAAMAPDEFAALVRARRSIVNA